MLHNNDMNVPVLHSDKSGKFRHKAPLLAQRDDPLPIEIWILLQSTIKLYSTHRIRLYVLDKLLGREAVNMRAFDETIAQSHRNLPFYLASIND